MFGPPSRIEAPDATETRYIYHESPTMSFPEVTVLVCIHSSIHLTNVYWEPITCQNPFCIYAKDVNSSLLLNGLHLNEVRWKNKTNKQKKTTRKIPEVTKMLERIAIG